MGSRMSRHWLDCQGTHLPGYEIWVHQYMFKANKFKLRGMNDFKAGKSFEDNPFLFHSQVAKSSWWQAGWLEAQKAETKKDPQEPQVYN